MLIVANEVSDLIFKTIHFHHYTQGESFVLMGVGWVWGWSKKRAKNEQIKLLPHELIFDKTNYAIRKVVVLGWVMYIFMSLPVPETSHRPFL